MIAFQLASVPEEDTPILESTWEVDMVSVKQWNFLLAGIGTAMPPDYVLYWFNDTLFIHAFHEGSIVCPRNWVLI